VFAAGVCDYSKQGIGFATPSTWLTY